MDRNKGIEDIIYNHFNLPKTIIFANGIGEISYLYDANGIKLKKTVNSEEVTNTHYLDGFQYTEDHLDFFPHAEGYVNVIEFEEFNYVYTYNDHLGNIRLRYALDPNTNVVTILEEDHYYPFGLKHKGYNSDHEIFERDDLIGVLLMPVNQFLEDKYKYKHQEQERQDELGLNWDSFKWRNYDYAIGRFMSIDPLSEKYVYNSTYAFQENKIGMGRELEGLEMVPVRTVDRRNATITYQVKPINNSRLSPEQFKTLIDARKALTEATLTGKTDDGVNLTTNVVFDDNATITWEYNEIITIGEYGNALGATLNIGNTQENKTQVNVYSHIGIEGNLPELILESIREITKTGTHEDIHVGGTPDIGSNVNPELETKMKNDPKGNIMDNNSSGTNALPEQRGIMLRNAEEQYKRD